MEAKFLVVVVTDKPFNPKLLIEKLHMAAEVAVMDDPTAAVAVGPAEVNSQEDLDLVKVR